jgi:hypothetical protein
VKITLQAGELGQAGVRPFLCPVAVPRAGFVSYEKNCTVGSFAGDGYFFTILPAGRNAATSNPAPANALAPG